MIQDAQNGDSLEEFTAFAGVERPEEMRQVTQRPCGFNEE
jgi:hypothetical protein